MKKKTAKEKLYQLILDLESEQTEIEKKIQDHKDEILQAEKYVQSLYEKEDTDVMIFSPRNIESRYKVDITKSKERIRILEKENQTLYHEKNVIKKRVSALKDIWRELYEHSEQLGKNSKQKNDINVNYEENEANMLHIVQALDDDRRRIASDLHDTIVQDLVHAIQMVELCNRYMDQDSVQTKLEFASIEKYLRETIQKARNFISDLRPMIFDDFGFQEAVLNAIEDLQKYTSMRIVTDIDELSGVNNEKCIVLYRIAMELLRNAIFHSGGDQVSLTIKKENGMIQLTVTDNGNGFSLNDDDTDKHFGLELVKERTYLIGAAFHIDSTEQGTCAQIILKE